MALVVGTNCGFVTTAPTEDPDQGAIFSADTYAFAAKFTSPPAAVKVTEIGWWAATPGGDGDFEVGIYTHNTEDNNPEALVGKSDPIAKGTSEGWIRISDLNISIDGDTTYWIAMQLDSTSSTTTIDAVYNSLYKVDRKSSQTTLPSPWETSNNSYKYLIAFYAVYETAPPTGTNQFINIGDAFKEMSELFVNIADNLRAVSELYVNIGDVWKPAIT